MFIGKRPPCTAVTCAFLPGGCVCWRGLPNRAGAVFLFQSLSTIHGTRHHQSSKASELLILSGRRSTVHDSGPRLRCRDAFVAARSLAKGLPGGCVLVNEGHLGTLAPWRMTGCFRVFWTFLVRLEIYRASSRRLLGAQEDNKQQLCENQQIVKAPQGL